VGEKIEITAQMIEAGVRVLNQLTSDERGVLTRGRLRMIVGGREWEAQSLTKALQ
jgi:hypothetical protein